MSRIPYVSVPVSGGAAGSRVSARDIVKAFVAEVKAGRLPAGCRVPPVRVLERQLGLSKNTVQAAYEELVARGVLEARAREGVFVAALDEAPPPSAIVAAVPLAKVKPVPELFRHEAAPGTIRLSTVFIDPDLLPHAQLADCLRAALRHPRLETQYGYQGYAPLREAIAERLRRRGMEVTADEVVTTVGSQQALDVVSRSLEIRRVALEDPVYAHARHLFERNGLEICGLRVDPFGAIDLDAWERVLATRRPGLLYAVTSFQNPTGYSYTLHELSRLLEIAARHDVALMEDDWGSDMLSDSEYRPSLRLLGGGNVLYVNSFTKKVLPALRVGFVVAPVALVPALVAAKRLSTLGSPPLLEAALADFLERGYYDSYLTGLQAELDRRYRTCLDALHELMPPGVRWTTPGGGPTLWLEVPRQIDVRALARATEARGVSIEETNVSFVDPTAPHLNGFRISYAHAPSETVRRGLEVVASEIAVRLGDGKTRA
jgi:GntR family transcriptional regulator/MocR family aminotransferase